MTTPRHFLAIPDFTRAELLAALGLTTEEPVPATITTGAAS